MGEISMNIDIDHIGDERLRAIHEIRRRRGAIAGYSPLMASSSVTTYWSQATSGALPSETRGSDLWTSIRPGKKEIWSYMSYGLQCGREDSNKIVKILFLETSMENKRRLVSATFHQPQEAYHFVAQNNLAWPGDQRPLDLERVKSEGLLKTWSKVWSAEVDACVRTSAESTERFVENFNTSSTNLHVRLPKTFVDQLLTQIHTEDFVPGELVKYESMGRGYFFPDQPPDDSDGSDIPDTPMYRRVYAFSKILVPIEDAEVVKYGFVRSRVKGDQYFTAVTPDYGYDDVDELKMYYAEDTNPYPSFDFDAKWMLEDFMRVMPDMA